MNLIVARYILFFGTLPLVTIAFSQSLCDVDSIMRYKGKWKKVSDANMRPGADQVQVITRIDKFQKILQATNPEPLGVGAEWYRSMDGNSLIKSGPLKYQLGAYFFIYRCDIKAKKMVPEDETGTVFSFFFNSFQGFMEELPFSIDNSTIYLLRKPIGEFNNEPLVEEIEESNLGKTYSRAILISRSGQKPYISVTRKEYLTAFIQGFQSGKANEIAELKAGVDTATYNEWIKSAKDFLLSMTTEEAEQPATVRDILSPQYFLAESKGGRRVVRLNPHYFNVNLPKYIPQFFVLHWRWDDLKPTNYCKDQLEKNLDFTLLRALLDK